MLDIKTGLMLDIRARFIGPMRVVRGLKRELSFIRGNFLVLLVSCALIDFAAPIPALTTHFSC